MSLVLYAFVLLCGLLGAGAYLFFFLSQVPGAAEDRLGVYEPLPEDLGKWKEERETPAASTAEGRGEQLEVRWLFEEGSFGSGGKLIRQSRVRDSKSGEIARILPEVVIKRRRIKKKA